MIPTELVYSSHDRCEYLHREWIVERALRSWHNKTIFYLPFSSGQRGDQEYSWGTFSGYLDRFRKWGLEPRSQIWSEQFSKEEALQFVEWLRDSEVVILGGGNTVVGIDRYRRVGEQTTGDPQLVPRILRDRRARGLLNVGFSSGAAQLSEWSCDFDEPARCYGLVRQVIVRLHHDWNSGDVLQALVREHPDCLVFGLPNDSGIASTEGETPRGAPWQLLEFVTDESWDKPEDQWHIKTRQGLRIEHRYADGRDWKFNGGDQLLRVFAPDGSSESFIKLPHLDRWIHYQAQQLTDYRSADEILRDR